MTIDDAGPRVVAIAKSVWESWRELEDSERKPGIALLLTSDAPPESSLKALAETLEEVMRPRLTWHERPGQEEFRPGLCSFVRVPQGVLLRVAEGPDDFAGLLRGVAGGLSERGIEGRFDLYPTEGAAELPEVIDLFECHLRLDGGRACLLPRGHIRWKPATAALNEAVSAGVAWCAENGSEFPLSLTVSLLPPVSLTVGDDVKRYVWEGIGATEEVGVVHLTSVAPDRFRTFAVEGSVGRAAFIEGGAVVTKDWQESVSHVVGVLRAAAPWAVYGFVKRGSLRTAAVLGISLPNDWLEVPHMNALIDRRKHVEDEFVPDPFGVQLLSAGHRGRIPDGQDWRVGELAGGRVFLEHVDPSAWFDGSLVRFGGHGNPYYHPYPRPPAVLTKAREDFDGLLYKDGRPPAHAHLGEARFRD